MPIKKLAVIFPGIGYHIDKPLLYYSKRLALEHDYDVIEITYDFPFKARTIKGDKDKMHNAFELAAEQVKEQLSTVEFSQYDTVLFIGKSIGTTVAAHYDKSHDINATHLVLTPVPQTFEFLRPCCGIVFNGTADPWCDTSLVEEKCKELGLELHVIDDANHSLETKSAVTDVRNMIDFMNLIGKLFTI